jgi:hypothetical protein
VTAAEWMSAAEIPEQQKIQSGSLAIKLTKFSKSNIDIQVFFSWAYLFTLLNF